MAYTGQVLDEGDEQIEFLATAADTGGELVRCRVTVAPKRPGPPDHSHPVQTETFRVERGRMGYKLGAETREAGPGEVAVIPPGTNHSFWNAGAEQLVMVTDVRPALRIEDFIETISVLIRDGKLNPGGKRANPLLLAAVAEEFRAEWRFTKLSPLARALLPILASIGRRGGLRGHYRADGKAGSRATASPV
ncbi:MAG TPA: cupin domain-containing protein [Candidatus Dormibacteraeota bacterium]|nr:cupin domain-containing protein [Candidatus Dormibacteraeota bacterium]